MSVTEKKLGEILRFDPTLPGQFAQAMVTIGSHVEFSIGDVRANPEGDIPLWESFNLEAFIDPEYPDHVSLRVTLLMQHTETDGDMLKTVATQLHHADKRHDRSERK